MSLFCICILQNPSLQYKWYKKSSTSSSGASEKWLIIYPKCIPGFIFIWKVKYDFCVYFFILLFVPNFPYRLNKRGFAQIFTHQNTNTKKGLGSARNRILGCEISLNQQQIALFHEVLKIESTIQLFLSTLLHYALETFKM